MFKIILPSLNIRVERWKYNKDFNIYVSSFGHFRDEHKKELKIKINSGGYCMIETWKGWKAVHRLVMMTFKPIKKMEELTIDHKNHNKRNNELSNLEWVTRETNLARAKKDLIIVPQEVKNQNIKAGQKKFNTIEEGVKWVIKYQKCTKNGSIPKEENIKKRINKAISTKTLYCNRKWTLI